MDGHFSKVVMVLLYILGIKSSKMGFISIGLMISIYMITFVQP